jgi:16S rRNA processing protein RimM
MNSKTIKLDNKEYVFLGECNKPHGLKGFCFIKLINPESSVIDSGSLLYFLKNNQLLPLEVDQISFGPKDRIKFKNYDSIEQIQTLLPLQLYMNRDDFPSLEEDEYYINDLLGASVFTLSVNGQRDTIGTIKAFDDHGASVIAVIGLDNGEQLQLPLVPAFFPEIDLESKQVQIVLPEVLN